MSASATGSVYVSYAWKAPDAPAMAELLQEVCTKNGIELRRDTNQIKYGDSLDKYMRELGAGGAIVVLVSEEYLKSPSCMYELLETEKNQRFRERVHPIVLPSGSGFDFFDVLHRLDVVTFWEKRGFELEARIGSLVQNLLHGSSRGGFSEIRPGLLIRNYSAAVSMSWRSMSSTG